MKSIQDALYAKKAEDIVVMDVRGVSAFTDYFVIVTGNNGPHLKALESVCADVVDKLGGVHRFRRSGTPESGWLVADYLWFVVHIFDRDTRTLYALEQLWKDAKPLEK